MKFQLGNKKLLSVFLVLTVFSILPLASAEFVYPSFSVEGQGQIRPQYGPYYLGQTLAIQAMPASGWHFAYFKRNGNEVTPHDNPHLFRNLESGESFIAVFESGVVSHDVTISVRGNGATSPAPSTYSYAEGAIIEVVATPILGSVFVGWELDGIQVGAHNPYTLVVTTNHNLVATFSIGDGNGGIPSYYYLIVLAVAFVFLILMFGGR